MQVADPRVTRAPDVVTLLAALQASDPGRPRVTWYGPDGERVELSARVLGTWVAKTANLIVEELDADAASTVVLDLPAHWRTLVWALAAWSTGAEVVWSQPAVARRQRGLAADLAADVVVTTDPRLAPPTTAGGHVVAVALPALARSFDGALDDALDYAAVVAGYGDVFVPVASPEHAALLRPARSAWPAGARLLSVGGALDLQRDLLGVLLADGSLVLCDAEPAPHVVTDERVSHRCDPAGSR